MARGGLGPSGERDAGGRERHRVPAPLGGGRLAARGGGQPRHALRAPRRGRERRGSRDRAGIPGASIWPGAAGEHSRQRRGAAGVAGPCGGGAGGERPAPGRCPAPGPRGRSGRDRSGRTMRVGWLLLLAAAVGAGRLPGQTIHPAVAASVVTARVRTEQLSEAIQFSGAAFGAEGTVSLGRVQLGLSYLQGRLDPDTGSAPARDLVEGSVLLGFRPVEWLTLSAGPHARAYATNGQTQRWVYWELRMRAAKPFIGTTVRGYAELWRAVAADANVPEPFGHAQGGEAGMIVRLARAPFEGRVAYRIDHAVLGGGSRLETVDGVVIGVGLSWR